MRVAIPDTKKIVLISSLLARLLSAIHKGPARMKGTAMVDPNIVMYCCKEKVKEILRFISYRSKTVWFMEFDLKIPSTSTVLSIETYKFFCQPVEI